MENGAGAVKLNSQYAGFAGRRAVVTKKLPSPKNGAARGPKATAALNRNQNWKGIIKMTLRTGALLVSLLMTVVPTLGNAGEPVGMYSTYRSDAPSTFDPMLGNGKLTPEQVMPVLLEALDHLSKYQRPVRLPTVLHVSRAQLEGVACRGRKCAVLAIYRPEAGIYIDEALHPETNVFDRSVLLHELVHHVQELYGEHSDMRPCDRWYYREVEAYAIQKQFLMLVGSPVRVGYSAARAVCDDTVHIPAAATHRDPAN